MAIDVNVLILPMTLLRLSLIGMATCCVAGRLQMNFGPTFGTSWGTMKFMKHHRTSGDPAEAQDEMTTNAMCSNPLKEGFYFFELR